MLSSFNALTVKTSEAYKSKDYAVLTGVGILVLLSVVLIARNPIPVAGIVLIMFLLGDDENALKKFLNKRLENFGITSGEAEATEIDLEAEAVQCELPDNNTKEVAEDQKEEKDPIPVAKA